LEDAIKKKKEGITRDALGEREKVQFPSKNLAGKLKPRVAIKGRRSWGEGGEEGEWKSSRRKRDRRGLCRPGNKWVSRTGRCAARGGVLITHSWIRGIDGEESFAGIKTYAILHERGGKMWS